MPTREERYWAKVQKTDGCWLWTACTNPCGYGMFRGDENEQLAHRYGWRLANGPIPPGKQILHHCDNPPCQNPAHLFLGDPTINSADKVAKGRQGRPPKLMGEANPRSKLNNAQVLEIRSRYLAGETQISIAKVFGVAQMTISGVVRGEGWGHLAVTPTDGAKRRRRGSDHPNAKLTYEQADEIRSTYFGGDRNKARLGRRYGVSEPTITRIVRGIGYRRSADNL